MDRIHRVVYINLDRRTDRREQMEGALDALRVPAGKRERFAAVAHARGAVGCSRSHLAVLRRARREGWPNVMVLEDDFQPAVDAGTWDARLARFLDAVPDFDVLLLAYNLRREDGRGGAGGARRTLDAQTTAGYVVRQPFYDTLIANVEAGVRQLERDSRRYGEFVLDTYWKRLQPRARWYHAVPRLGTQRASYSDIEQTHVDYGV